MKLLTTTTAATTGRMALMALIASVATSLPAADDKLTFDDNVLAVLRQRCGGCHNPDKKSGDLDVTSYTSLMQGGGSGGAIEPGNASASYLYKLITHQDEPKMPPDSPPIPEEERALIKKWIEGGVLENKGSKAAAAKKTVAMAMDAAPTERPAVTPLPARIPLEPVIRTQGVNACASIATSPWAPLAAVCGQKQVLLYRTDTRQLAGVLPFPEGRPQVLQFSRNGSLLVGGGGRGGASGRVVVWNVATGRRVTELGEELDTVLAADISADQRLVALGGPQRVVRVYSTETGERLHELRKHTDWIMAASFSPDGVLLATCDRSGGVVVWEAATGRDFLTLTGHTASVTSVSWRSDSNLLATGSEDGTIRLWEMENGSEVKSWPAHAGGVAALEFTRDGRIVSVGRDKIPKIWGQDGTQQKAFETCADLGLAISYCDETDAVIVGDWTGEIRIWKGSDAVRVGGLSSNPETLAERTAAAERAVAERAPAVEPARMAAEATTAQMAAMQKQIDDATQAKAAAETILADLKKQLETATQHRTEVAKAQTTAEQAAAAAAAKATDLAAELEAARADLTRWQDETVFLGRYRELAGVVATREAVVREAEAKVAEGQVKVAADEQARQALVNERQAKEKEIAALTAAVAKAQQDHADMLQKVADKQGEMTAAQATMDQLGKAVGSLEAAAVSAKLALDAVPADRELAEVQATLVKTVAAKAAQIKSLGESQATMAAEKAAREKEAAELTARAEKLNSDMPAVTARMQELDGMITKAATVVETSAAAVRSLEPPVAERQKEVDAAVGQLSALQGLPPGT